MARPRPWLRSENQTWYVEINKRQVSLGKDESEAWRQYHRLMDGASIVDTEPVVCLLDQFLEWVENNLAEGTLRFYKRYLSSFYRSIGNLPIRELKPVHVTHWVDRLRVKGTRRRVSNTTKNQAIGSVKRALNWAVEQGLIDRNPVARMRRPAAGTRETIITPEQWQQMIENVQDDCFTDYVTVLRETGCRPQEARLVEAKHVKGDRWIFERETSKGKRHVRVVYLSEKARKITERLMRANPTGRLFRNRQGGPWRRNAITYRFRRLSKRLGFKVTAYVIRHTWATEALERGVDPITVAILMGHRDTTMVARVYQHLTQKPEHLQKALQRALGGLDGPDGPDGLDSATGVSVDGGTEAAQDSGNPPQPA